MANAKKISDTKKVGGRKKNPSRRPSSSRKKPRAAIMWIYMVAIVIIIGLLAISYRPILCPAFKRFTSCDGHNIYGTCIPKGYSVYGIDVSHHQGEINWKRLKRGNPSEPPITFVYIKATEGYNHDDTRFERNWKAAKKNGFICGAYHYFGTKSPGEIQARQFISKVKLEPGDLPPVVDVEEEPENAEAYREELKKFISVLEKHYGVKPIIYTYKKFHERHINNTHFNSYPLWIARYEASHPGIDDKWIIWQCTEDGRLPGIDEDVDINVFNGTAEEFQKLIIKSRITPP